MFAIVLTKQKMIALFKNMRFILQHHWLHHIYH